MSGDHTRFTFKAEKRFSDVTLQQGRVALDADWNEQIDIVRRQIRTTTRDVLGPLGVPVGGGANAFNLTWVGGPTPDLKIEPGRLYADGIQVEAFAGDQPSYNHQPFLPPQLAGFPPPALPATGNAVAYLDVWDREITYIEDADLLDDALGGADTAARRQTVWQLKVDPVQNAACGLPVGSAVSAGRLSTDAIAPPAPDDPCILPPASGYRGLENRLYRVEIHQGGTTATARFKWSRDNGAIVSVVRSIAVGGGQTTLSVNRIGRDKFMRFKAGDWVTVSDDHRELTGEAGDMAKVMTIDEVNRQIVLDRALPKAGTRAFGADAAAVMARHTRIQRWDQTAATNPTLDADGLVPVAAGGFMLEDGIKIELSVAPVGGSFRLGDYWVFWARTATARIEKLSLAPPRGIQHHSIQIAALTGIGNAGGPVITQCRPPQLEAGDCCCTIIVRVGEDIQKGIDALPPQGGCVCLKTGEHVVQQTLRILRSNIVLKAESPGTSVTNTGDGPVLVIGDEKALVSGVDVLGIDFVARLIEGFPAVVVVASANRVRLSNCGMTGGNRDLCVGILARAADHLKVLSCHIEHVSHGIWALERCRDFEADSNAVALFNAEMSFGLYGILYQKSSQPCRITRNVVANAMHGIVLNDESEAAAFTAAAVNTIPHSLAMFSIVNDNMVFSGPMDSNDKLVPVGIDVAANACSISGNRVGFASLPFVGIRVTGSACDLDGNVVVSQLRDVGSIFPTGILVGHPAEGSGHVVDGGLVVNNVIGGLLDGIICAGVKKIVVENNLILGARQKVRIGLAADRATRSHFSHNHFEKALGAILISNGAFNLTNNNSVNECGAGVSLLKEQGPHVSGNRLTQLELWGIAALTVEGRLDIAENQIVVCGTQMPQGAFGIGFGGVNGEAHIAGNEVVDVGDGGGENAVSPRDCGIVGLFVREARVADNLVTYSDFSALQKRNMKREDRALLMGGLFDFSQGEDKNSFGFPIQIQGNRFYGTGFTALVELVERQLTDQFFQRFDRVSFDLNFCQHFTVAVDGERRLQTTVKLVGRYATVTGNHIKCSVRIPSVDFRTLSGDMRGPFANNVTRGGSIRPLIGTAEFPAPENAFNIIAS